MKQTIKSLTIIMTIAILSGCSSTKLTSSWIKDGYTPIKYNKVLVFAITTKVNNRAIVESTMVTELKKAGVDAVASVYLFPLSQNITSAEQLQAIPKETIDQKFKENGIDGFLVLSLLQKKEEQVYVQGQTYTTPVGYGYGGYGGYGAYGYGGIYGGAYGNYYNYYSSAYTTVSTPGYYKEQTSFFLESNFYNVGADGSMVWSGQSEAIDPSGISQGALDWSVAVVNGMKEKKVFLKSAK